jgi:hypothetical protein
MISPTLAFFLICLASSKVISLIGFSSKASVSASDNSSTTFLTE